MLGYLLSDETQQNSTSDRQPTSTVECGRLHCTLRNKEHG